MIKIVPAVPLYFFCRLFDEFSQRVDYTTRDGKVVMQTAAHFARLIKVAEAGDGQISVPQNTAAKKQLFAGFYALRALRLIK